MPTRSRGYARPSALAMAALLAAMALSGCATPPTDPVQRAEFDRINDPLEPMNRKIFAVNKAIDKYALRPVAIGYRSVVPEFARNGVHNALQNLGEPLTFGNKLLQGEPVAAGKTLVRFTANSTLGVAGLIDVATPRGLARQPAGDFGATLHQWGVGDGPYVVLPLFGPSSTRDAVGGRLDSFIDPVGSLLPDGASTGTSLGKGLDMRANTVDSTDELERSSVDYYATLRSVMRQRRQTELDGTRLPADGDLYADPAAAG